VVSTTRETATHNPKPLGAGLDGQIERLVAPHGGVPRRMEVVAYDRGDLLAPSYLVVHGADLVVERKRRVVQKTVQVSELVTENLIA
jgi:hypothetical protein